MHHPFKVVHDALSYPTDDDEHEDEDALDDETSVKNEEGDDPGQLLFPHSVNWKLRGSK